MFSIIYAFGELNINNLSMRVRRKYLLDLGVYVGFECISVSRAKVFDVHIHSYPM